MCGRLKVHPTLLGLLALAGVLSLLYTVVFSGRDGKPKGAGSLDSLENHQGLAGGPTEGGRLEGAKGEGGPGWKTANQGAAAKRTPAPFRENAVKTGGNSGIAGALGDGIPAKERVGMFQAMRGTSISQQDMQRALEFLKGEERPEGLSLNEIHWLADELLTVLRMQNPPQEDLAEDLAKVAFQPDADPVIRDYIMQHLGHLWEQDGPRKEIEAALWKAVETADETTPGTALIALSRGYERDEQTKSLVKVRQRAMELARNPSTPPASRVTALAIAGEDGGKTAKDLAESLLKEPETPLILRKVAENIRNR